MIKAKLTLLSIEYNKKPGKLATVKAVKDPAIPRDDVYKSGTIRTGPGEPPNSVSKPTPRPKPAPARPVTKGKLLRPGGPNGGPSKLGPTRPNGTASRTVPQPATQSKPASTETQQRVVPQPAAVAAAAASHNRESSQSSVCAPPPPPPAPPAAAPKKPTAKVLYDFSSERSNELNIRAGEFVTILNKEGNGIVFNYS